MSHLHFRFAFPIRTSPIRISHLHFRVASPVRFVDSRILDDERYALALAEGQRRRGSSLAKVRQKLMARGLAEEHIERALDALGEDEELSEEASAAIYVRKRRILEKFDLSDPKQRDKALASLARQGFSFDVARGVLGL